MHDISDETVSMVNRYLDDEMTELEAQEFTQRLAGNPDLKAHVASLKGIESCLTEMYDTNEWGEQRSDVRRHVLGRQAAKHHRVARKVVERAIIYAVIIAATLGIVFYSQRTSTPQRRIDARLEHLAFLEDPIPEIVCDTPEKFLVYTSEKLGEPIEVRFDTDIVLIGWKGIRRGYSDSSKVIEPRLLLAEGSDGTPIIVLFQLRRALDPLLDSDSELHMFSKDFGSITVWEITPNDEPVVVGLLSRAPR